MFLAQLGMLYHVSYLLNCHPQPFGISGTTHIPCLKYFDLRLWVNMSALKGDHQQLSSY
jgi:hypothetical protein